MASRTQCVDPDTIKTMIRAASWGQHAKADSLYDELQNPECEVDWDETKICYQAHHGQNTPNKIRFGARCTRRLQYHAHAYSLIVTEVLSPSFDNSTAEDVIKRVEPAFALLSWVVRLDMLAWIGEDFTIEHEQQLMHEVMKDAPNIARMSEEQEQFGKRMSMVAVAFIFMHEVAHLKFRHSRSIENEKEADRFAARWICDAASDAESPETTRQVSLFGITIALMWGTVLHVNYGMTNSTSHPQAYDRLFQVMDDVIDHTNREEYNKLWSAVTLLLQIHMQAANYEFDAEHDVPVLSGDQREAASYLIDRIINQDRRKEIPILPA